MDELQTVGILGGMSSESTIEYYRRIDQGINDVYGGHAAGDLLIRSVNFAEIERCIRTEQWDTAARILTEAARDLERGGAAFLVLATNTMHKLAPELTDAISIPFVHIVDVTAEAILSEGISRVGLLGTQTTMEAPFYRDRFASHGIEIVTPDPPDRTVVDRIIFEELTNGIVREASKERYLEVIETLIEDDAAGIVLGCTEIEMLVDQRDRPDVPLFDTTALHTERAVERCLPQ